ncbi:GntR family transcriptional regulator [Neobacillus cucumis]|uniref:GntR family transcriptional regulator n=1 Tax=Neobacillus cucumis TaxID=1740721 RepID=A0A2N5H686_9BACI|nr:GntR family transcriptional regulator [Neobacillus cucumis]PLS01047.1 GntR family transcriptional regulator [Neobacillus cucumis]
MQKKTKHLLVKDTIKEWITNGEIKPGDKIYSENELVKMFGVSRHTVRQAVGDLVHEGWLYREQGAGTFCSNRMIDSEGQSQKQSRTVNSKNIGVITTYISDYIFPSIIKGIESYLTEKGYSLTFSCTDNNIEKEKQCLESMLSRNVDGLIIEPTKSSSFNPNINHYLELEQLKIPYLMINQFYSQLNPPHLVVNDEKGGFLATEHLIKLGHKKILGIFKSDDLQGVRRMQGYIQAHRENDLTLSPDLILTFSTGELDHSRRKLEDLLSSNDSRPTGIICYNDQVALFVLNILRELNLKIPEDISIVGYDDSYLAEATETKLTSVSHPKMQMGMEAAKWIVAAVERQNNNHHSIVYEPELVIRNSTGPVKSEKVENL